MLSLTSSGCGLILLPALLYTSVAENKLLEVCFPMCRNLLYQEYCTGMCSVIRGVRQIAKSDHWIRHARLSVCPSVCPHGTTRLLPERFSWNWIFLHFRKSVEKVQVSLTSDENSGYFTWRPIYIFGLNSFIQYSHTIITNLMHWLLFIRKILLLSSTCFEYQVVIFRKT